jgi:hypothetical protein
VSDAEEEHSEQNGSERSDDETKSNADRAKEKEREMEESGEEVPG